MTSAAPACVTAPAPPVSHPVSTGVPVISLATGLDQPDDVLQDGRRLLIGEMGAGDIVELGAGGRVTLPGHVNGVEGLAVLDGTLYAADQLDDRVVSVSPSGAVRTVLQLSPVSGVEGVDGIAAGGGELVVPDAARGRVLWVRPDGTVTRSAGGFSRPAGAFAQPHGGVLVADENLGGVFQVNPDGSRTRLDGALPEADDVVQDAAGTTWAVAVYVRGDVLARLSGASWDTVASGSWQPQGVTLDPAGNPVVADPNSGSVYDFLIRPELTVAPGVLRVPGGDAICLHSMPGPVTVRPGAGYRVLGPVEILPAACSGTCSIWVAASSGGAWIRYTAS